MMGIRLIFRNHILCVTASEGRRKVSRARIGSGFKLVGRFSRQIRRTVNPEKRIRSCRKARESAQLRCQEKLRRKCKVCPYRKPTQVGKENILRRASELSFRN